MLTFFIPHCKDKTIAKAKFQPLQIKLIYRVRKLLGHDLNNLKTLGRNVKRDFENLFEDIDNEDNLFEPGTDHTDVKINGNLIRKLNYSNQYIFKYREGRRVYTTIRVSAKMMI